MKEIIPLLCYDIIFKSVFMHQENILGKMVSDITGLNYNLLKDNLILEVNELPIHRKNEKAKRCDFVLKVEKDTIIDLELNRHYYIGLESKNISYLFKLFSTASEKGEKYNDNLMVLQINLNCFHKRNILSDDPLFGYHFREDFSHELYCKSVGIYDLDIVKCYELYYNKEKEDIPNYVRWGALLYCKSIEEIPDIAKGIITSEERNKIMVKINQLTREDLFMTQEEAQRWDEWEQNSIYNDAFNQGIELMIKNMLKKNIPIEDIAEIAGKNVEEIAKYVKN